MSKEDRDLARKMALADRTATEEWVQQNNYAQLVGYNLDGGLEGNVPGDDGDGLFAGVTIGERGWLSKREARASAEAWRKLAQRYPKGLFVITMHGYDQDPRNIWEVPEAARYVRWWARYAGVDNIGEAYRFFGPNSKAAALGPVGNGLGFLAACGVFGEEIEQKGTRRSSFDAEALAGSWRATSGGVGFKPIIPHQRNRTRWNANAGRFRPSRDQSLSETSEAGDIRS
jgi:hypothetical protein